MWTGKVLYHVLTEEKVLFNIVSYFHVLSIFRLRSAVSFTGFIKLRARILIPFVFRKTLFWERLLLETAKFCAHKLDIVRLSCLHNTRN
jgi:hypothetical protein